MIRINLLGRKKKLKFKPVHLELSIYALALIVLVIGVYLVHTNLNSRVTILNDEIAIVDGRLSKLKKIKKEIDGFEKKKNDLQKKIKTVLDLKRSQKGYYTILTKLEASMPQDVWVSGMSYSGNSVGLSCSSLKYVSVNEFIVNLFESDMFYDIDINSAVKSNQSNVEINNFGLNTKVNLGE